ncbi:TPA: TIGR02452 family protein [Legionella pneumophila subsp. pneumophila]|nr:TIGR02452 family protein [Legionella pneumophila subsp. pneumophila]
MPRDLLCESETPPGHPMSDSKKRRIVLRDTVEKFSQDNFGLYEKQAKQNHQAWKLDKAELPNQVRVIAGDWGDVTLALSKATGNIYAVLNMANAYIPGGGYLEGLGAQEENIYRRSNCHFYIYDEEMDEDKSSYKQEMSDLINGVYGKVYLDVQNPRVCIKGREEPDVSGYIDLEPTDYFLFYELKSAADNLSDARFFDEASMRKKIAAQLDTLKAKNIRHVVLSAFGCGAFGNPAKEVAKIYREELQKHAGDFDDVVFAVYDTEYGPNNFEPFKESLDGMPLGKEQLDKLKELLLNLKKNINLKEWDRIGLTFLYFNFRQTPPGIMQMRQVLQSDMSEVSKIKQIQKIAKENIETFSFSSWIDDRAQIFYQNIMKITLGTIDDDLINLFKTSGEAQVACQKSL